jgi:hypothetical protein
VQGSPRNLIDESSRPFAFPVRVAYSSQDASRRFRTAEPRPPPHSGPPQGDCGRPAWGRSLDGSRQWHGEGLVLCSTGRLGNHTLAASDGPQTGRSGRGSLSRGARRRRSPEGRNCQRPIRRPRRDRAKQRTAASSSLTRSEAISRGENGWARRLPDTGGLRSEEGGVGRPAPSADIPCQAAPLGHRRLSPSSPVVDVNSCGARRGPWKSSLQAIR